MIPPFRTSGPEPHPGWLVPDLVTVVVPVIAVPVPAVIPVIVMAVPAVVPFAPVVVPTVPVVAMVAMVTVVATVAAMVAVVAPIMMVVGRHALNRAGRRRSGGHCQASEAECSNKQRGPDNAQLCVVHGVSLFQFYFHSG